MKNNSTTVHIGHVNESNLMFHGEYEISRRNPNDTVTFLGEKYRRVNTELNCYIKESEYQKLFGHA
jgi:hypothetical protein